MKGRPFSVLQYMARHKSQTCTIAATIALTLAMVCTLHLFLSTLQQFYKSSYLSPNRVFSSVYHQYGKPFAAPPPVDGVAPIPAREDVFSVYSVLGKVNARVWSVPQNQVAAVVDALGMSLRQGALPQKTGQIAVPAQWAANRGVAVGDTIDLSFGATPDIRIVGLLDAPDMQCGVGILPQGEAGCYLYVGAQVTAGSFQPMLFEGIDVLVENYQTRLGLYRTLYDNTFAFGGLLLSAIVLLVGVVCILSVISVHLEVREAEFSLLGALGWPPRRFERYFLRETLLYFLLAFALAAILYALVGCAIGKALFSPQGIPVVWFSGRGLVSLLLVLCIGFASFYSKGRRTILKSISMQRFTRGE